MSQKFSSLPASLISDEKPLSQENKPANQQPCSKKNQEVLFITQTW